MSSSQYQGLGNVQYVQSSWIFQYKGEPPPKPDPDITRKEDENVRLAREADTNSSIQDLRIPLRLDYGEKLFVMRTNYFWVTLNMKKELFRYDIKIVPNSDSARALLNRRKRRQFFKILFEDQPDFKARGHGIATDYANTLITCGRLYDKSLPSREYVQTYRSGFEESPDPVSTTQSNDQKYKVTVEYTGMVSSSELIKYCNSKPTDPSDFNPSLDPIQALNIIVAGAPNKNQAVFQAGQNKFFEYRQNKNNGKFQDIYGEYDLTGGLIAVRGYYSSIRTSTSRILLNLNPQCSAFYPEMNLLELMCIFARVQPISPIPPEKYQELEEFIQRLRVRTVQMTREGKHVTREKTIKGFSHKFGKILDQSGKQVLNANGVPKTKGTKGAAHDYGSSESIKFLSDASTSSPAVKISVSDYFTEHYKQSLDYPKYFVVNCGTDEEPRWIPPERCTVMPGQPYRGTLDRKQTDNMHTIAARSPSENARRLNGDGLSVIGIRPESQTLKSFGVTIDTQMLSVHARLLPTPKVMYQHQKSLKPKLAAWNLRGYLFHKAVPIDKWSYLVVDCRYPLDQVWKDFQTALKNCGMGEIDPYPFEGLYAELHGDGDNDFSDKAIRVKIEEAKNRLGLQILWVILPRYSAPIYARVKYWADVIYGIHTVCVLSEKLDKGPMYHANVSHKFNLKLGGVNHKVHDDDLGILKKEPTMVVGIDVTHPAPRSMENAPSTVGMVANIDNMYSQWPGSLRIQKGRQEIQKRRRENQEQGIANLPEGEEVTVPNVAEMLEERLKAYFIKNGKLPMNIIIYRDGVSEGQYQAVLDIELRSIQKQCKERYQKKELPPPKIALVIVAKRHHTRFYPTSDKFIDNAHFADKKHKERNIPLGNPLNGTVVDRGVTMQKGWDFYLQSHVALKGTAKPTHYVVLHDDIGLGEGKLETITHNLCYSYGIATKAVSVCPPAYYADILCERGRCYLMKHLSMRGKPPGTKFVESESPWKKGVHTNLQNSMFYI